MWDAPIIRNTDQTPHIIIIVEQKNVSNLNFEVAAKAKTDLIRTVNVLESVRLWDDFKNLLKFSNKNF